MNIDPSTTLYHLVAAIPSSEVLLKRLGMTKGPADERTLEQACNDAHIPVEVFLKHLDNIDWDAETVPRKTSERPL